MLSQRSYSRSIGALIVLSLVLPLLFAATPAAAEEEEMRQRFSAIAQNIGALGPRGQVRLDIDIERWSTEEERAALIEALKTDAARALPEELHRFERVGRIRELQQLGHDLNYSREVPMEGGGRRIILATDRPLGFAEVSRNRRTTDYNVSLIIMDLDAEGSGEGQLMLGIEFTWNEEENQLIIENMSSEPVRLSSIRMR